MTLSHRLCRAALIVPVLTAASIAASTADEPLRYPVEGRYGLAAHRRGASLESAKPVLHSPANECADIGRWFEFHGGTRLDHFSGTVLTFTLKQAKFTPPNTYYLLEGDAVGDALILHKDDDKTIDVVITNGTNLYIQLWMLRCDSL